MTRKENLIRAIKRDNPEWVPNTMETQIYLIPPVVERPVSDGYDSWGVHFSYEEKAEGGTYPTVNGHPIKDVTEWREQIKVPDIEAFDWNRFTTSWDSDELFDISQIKDRENCIVTGAVGFGIFERSYLLLGMEDALVSYMTEPEEMYEIAGVIADYKIKLIKKFNSVIKLDMVWFGDDWGTQRSLFLPPNIWRKIIKPHTKRIYDCMKELGIIINHHSCGKIEEIFGDFVEMGPDIWNPCQPCNDLANLKKLYGDKICFYGGLDSQFVLNRPGVKPEEVRIEVRKRIDEMAEDGGYIAAPSHDVPYSKEVLAAMNDEIESYGRKAYQK